MKKFITFLIATFFVSMVFANVYCPQTIKCIAKGCAIPTGWYAKWSNVSAKWPHGRYLHKDKGIYKLWWVIAAGKTISNKVSCLYVNTRQNAVNQPMIGLAQSNTKLRPALSTKQNLWISVTGGYYWCVHAHTISDTIIDTFRNPAGHLINTLLCPLK